MPPACDMVTDAGNCLLMATHQLKQQPFSNKVRYNLVDSARNILEGTMKVLTSVTKKHVFEELFLVFPTLYILKDLPADLIVNLWGSLYIKIPWTDFFWLVQRFLWICKILAKILGLKKSRGLNKLVCNNHLQNYLIFIFFRSCLFMMKQKCVRLWGQLAGLWTDLV